MNRRRFLVAALAMAGKPGFLPAGDASLPDAYQRFVSAHSRNGQVFDNGNGNITHSEGQGVLLLFSALLGDPRVYRATRDMTLHLRRSDGLFSWLDAHGHIVDDNDAADGDLYIAWGLAIGGQRFGRPADLDLARQTLLAVRSRLLRSDPHGTILLPGAQGFSHAGQPPVINLSYWLLPAFGHFAALAPEVPWSQLADSGLRIAAYSYFGRWALPPDWLLLSDPVRPAPGFPPRFGDDAIRIPLWLFWAGQDRHPLIGRFLRWVRNNPALPAWVDLATNATASYPAGPGQLAIAETISRQPMTHTVSGDSYYQDSLILLARLAAQARAHAGPAPAG